MDELELIANQLDQHEKNKALLAVDYEQRVSDVIYILTDELNDELITKKVKNKRFIVTKEFKGHVIRLNGVNGIEPLVGCEELRIIRFVVLNNRRIGVYFEPTIESVAPSNFIGITIDWEESLTVLEKDFEFIVFEYFVPILKEVQVQIEQLKANYEKEVYEINKNFEAKIYGEKNIFTW